MARTLLSGNEAIARGAWEAGATVGVGYPGTPSTEVLENLVRYAGVYAEWAPNEKVAFEVGLGASLGGARTIVTMKHVGLNVAADPLFTAAYTGVEAGLVVLVADDPGMHSSQNEQDTRNYAHAAKVPLLEPSDSAEALAFVAEAFEISERYDTPVIVRSTTRLAHSKGLVEEGERVTPSGPSYRSRPAKYVMMPGMARRRRAEMTTRLADLRAYAERTDLNRVYRGSAGLGVVTSGVTYQYVREALPEASVLKLGMPYPFPADLVRSFAQDVERLAVVEDLDPFLRLRVSALGIVVMDVDVPEIGELSAGRIAAAFGAEPPSTRQVFTDLPPRPPLLCPGCPHRLVFRALSEMDAVVTGDIGCYTLGALPPLSAMDTCVCMGAGIGMAHGLEVAGAARPGEGVERGGLPPNEERRPVVAVIGDSTFMHSGITGLIDIVYNHGAATVVILDNRVTAMTGHQPNPASGRTLSGAEAHELDLEALCRACGVEDVRTVDAHLRKPVAKAISEAVASPRPSVVIARAPCALIVREPKTPFAVVVEKCDACGECIAIGCPAISKGEDARAVIDAATCVGCRQCVQMCSRGAITRFGPTCPGGEA